MILNCMLGSGFGGLEKLFLDEIEMLLLANMPVHGVLRRNSPLAAYAKKRGVPFEEIIAWSDWDPVSTASVRRVVRNHSPELVMCVGRGAHRLVAHAVGTNLPIVVMVQKRRFDLNLPYAGVLAAAEHRRRTLIEDGVPAEKIAVIPNAVRLPPQPKSDYRLRPGSGAKIVALGRLHEKKGFGVLVETIALLRRQGIDCSCTIAGEGPERARLESQVAREELASSIHLPGWTDRVAEFLAEGDIFVLPSFQEDFPLAVLDAMASGVPIVASAIDGPKDFLSEGTTGLLVPPNNASALAHTLVGLLASDSLRESLGRAARREAEERYSFQAIGRDLSAALENVMRGRAITGSVEAPT
jgi:glycosyltransferase involved in cell wall biosynthesis